MLSDNITQMEMTTQVQKTLGKRQGHASGQGIGRGQSGPLDAFSNVIPQVCI
jgi:hypothetical protein